MKTYLVVRPNFELVKIRAKDKRDAISRMRHGQGEDIHPTPRQQIVLDKLNYMTCMTPPSAASIPNHWMNEKTDKKKLRELLRSIQKAI